MLLAATLAISAVATTTAAAKPAKPAASSDIKVGLVTDIAGLGDKSFNFLAGEGLKQAEKKYGIQGDVTVSKSNNDYVPNITKYALKGYDLDHRRRLPRGAGGRAGRQEVPRRRSSRSSTTA